MRMLARVLRGIVAALVLSGCAEEQGAVAVPAGQEIPFGSWLMYGSSGRGTLSAEELGQEQSVLVLGDSTYSLTYRREDAQLMFVESGKVWYDTHLKRATFTVTSATGMDWSQGEPRKLLTIPDLVPFQRDPGHVYAMEWSLQDSVLGLSSPEMEGAWFVRWPR